MKKIRLIVIVLTLAALVFALLRILQGQPLIEKKQKVAAYTPSGVPLFRRALGVGSITTADPNANVSTKTILHSLGGLYGEKQAPRFLVGQNIGHASAVGYNNGDPFDLYAKYVVELKKQTGKTPAILGVDYGWEEFDVTKLAKINELIIGYWKKGGLVTISMNPANPWTGVKGSRSLTTGTYAFDDLFQKGSVPYNRLTTDLDAIAKGLQGLSDAGVVVLWRPYHEMNGGWAWWSFEGKGDAIVPMTALHYKKLWDFTFDYLTKEKNLHNLLFVYSPNATYGYADAKPITFYYPGGDRVDVAAMDYYRDDMSEVNKGGDYDALVSLNKPIGFGEIGSAGKDPIDDRTITAAISTEYPQMSFAMFWSGWSSLGGLIRTKKAIIENTHPQEFMQDPLVLTRDDVSHILGREQ